MVPTFFSDDSLKAYPTLESELEKTGCLMMPFLLKMYFSKLLGDLFDPSGNSTYIVYLLNVHIPGDSSRDLFIPQLQVTNNHLKGHFFHHPKKVTIAELPGMLFSHPTSTLLGCPNKLVKGY